MPELDAIDPDATESHGADAERDDLAETELALLLERLESAERGA